MEHKLYYNTLLNKCIHLYDGVDSYMGVLVHCIYIIEVSIVHAKEYKFYYTGGLISDIACYFKSDMPEFIEYANKHKIDKLSEIYDMISYYGYDEIEIACSILETM